MNPTAVAADAIANRRPDPAGDEAVFAKVSWHIMPLLFICYFIAYLDRVNIG